MRNDAQPQPEPTPKLSEDSPALRTRGVRLQGGDLLAARYEIQALLGAGGMATVYRAFDRVTEQTIAVKVLDEDRSAARGWSTQLARELRVARRVKHPNICQVFDFFEQDGRSFLTMELAPGGTLREVFHEEGDSRSLARRLADARAVIEGVAAIHQAGIVHRDLKPENVLRAADGRLMISDLGVAVRADLTTHSAGPAGTRSYMAPELLFGEKATRASDVWSLGLILHEILFGCRPEWSLVGDVRRLNIPPSAAAPSLRALQRLCAECLVERPARRLGDAEVVRRRFEEAVRGRQSWRGRRIALSVTAGLVLLGAVLVLAGKRPAPRGVLQGRAVDLAKVSVPVFTTSRDLTRCAQLLPDGKTLRLFLRNPLEAVDVALQGGQASPAKLVPEAMVSGCPQLSPDGRRLLYEKPRTDGRPQVMLSDWPDGRDARLVTEGEGPFWLASGDAFLYQMDTTRSAVFALGRGPVLFPDPGTSPRAVNSHAVSSSGDLIAVAFTTVVPEPRQTLELYSYPQTALLKRVDLPVAGSPWAELDPARGTWQLSLADPHQSVRCELREDGSCERLLALDGADVLATYRSSLGLVAITSRRSRTATVTRKADGETQGYRFETFADFGPGGEAALAVVQPNGRSVIAMQRFGQREPRIVTDGPHDRFPSINMNGRILLYNGGDGHGVYSCHLEAERAEGCHVIHEDPMGPMFPRLSPNGRWLAYEVSDAAGRRLRIVPLDGKPMRDLSVRGVGPILWTSETTLWSCEGDARMWTEIDAPAGRPTGRRISRPELASACEPPPELAEVAGYEIRRALDVTTEVRLVRGM